MHHVSQNLFKCLARRYKCRLGDSLGSQTISYHQSLAYLKQSELWNRKGLARACMRLARKLVATSGMLGVGFSAVQSERSSHYIIKLSSINRVDKQIAS